MSPHWAREQHAESLETGVRAWRQYADAHSDLYSTLIGNDCVLGPAWKAWGKALLDLLNGELGRLEGHATDAWIRRIAEQNGVDLDGES